MFSFSTIKKSFKTDDRRSANVVRNSFISGILKIATLACSLLMVPVTIDYLNQENYGIWMAMTSILYWFVFLDVGLGNGLRNYLAEAISRNDMLSARSYISTAFIMLSGISVVLAFVFIPLVYVFDLNEVFRTTSYPVCCKECWYDIYSHAEICSK